MRLLDRLCVGSWRQAQDRIGLFDAHVAACWLCAPATAASGAGGTFTAELIAPLRMHAVEVSLEKARALLIIGAAFAQQRQEVGRTELLEAHPGKAAAQDRPFHPASVMVQGHAQESGCYRGGLPTRGRTVTIEKTADPNQ